MRRRDLDYDLLRRLVSDWRRVAHLLLGDFYPLTPYSVSADAWMAWQFDLPERGEGMVQAFRRAASPDPIQCLCLRGLDPEASYLVTDLDDGQESSRSGRQLVAEGLTITLSQAPSAAIYTYRRT